MTTHPRARLAGPLLHRFLDTGGDRGRLFDLGWASAVENVLAIDLRGLRAPANDDFVEFIEGARWLFLRLVPALAVDVPDRYRWPILAGFVQGVADLADVAEAAPDTDEDHDAA